MNRKQGLLPLYFYKDTQVSLQVLRALYNTGIRAVEYTNRGEAALQNFKKCVKYAMRNYWRRRNISGGRCQSNSTAKCLRSYFAME